MALDPTLIKPRDLPALSNVTATDAVMVDNSETVGRATPVQVVNAGAPVASEAEAIAGTDNTKRMTALRVRQVLNSDAFPFVALSEAWAESPTPPDPLDPDSKSSKTWSGEAALYDGPKVDTFAGLASVTSSMMDVGDLIRVIETGAVYERVSTGGDLNYTGTGGVRLSVVVGAQSIAPEAFSAVGNGTANDAVAFTAARAVGG